MNMKTPAIVLLLLAASNASAIDQCAHLPAPIPDNDSGGVIVEIEVDAPGELVESLTIDLGIVHDWVGDLVVTLQSPSGSIVTLLDRPGIPSVGFPGPFGCGGRDADVTFTDGAAQPAETMCSTTATPVLNGVVAPASPMNALTGEPADGLWVLSVSDHSLYDTGSVTLACLHIESVPACTADFTADGTLDIFDVFAFIEAFNAMDPLADFTGDGVFSIFDVFGFVEAFNAGCP